ncbi:MAG: hypothetical protein C0407_05930, partial [Desulfobacca sp.]|nr:hypothetical protein [Desulfobacca sp.]
MPLVSDDRSFENVSRPFFETVTYSPLALSFLPLGERKPVRFCSFLILFFLFISPFGGSPGYGADGGKMAESISWPQEIKGW